MKFLAQLKIHICLFQESPKCPLPPRNRLRSIMNVDGGWLCAERMTDGERAWNRRWAGPAGSGGRATVRRWLFHRQQQLLVEATRSAIRDYLIWTTFDCHSSEESNLCQDVDGHNGGKRGAEERGERLEQTAGGGAEEGEGEQQGGGEWGCRVQQAPLPPPVPGQQVGDRAGHRLGSDHLHPLASSSSTRGPAETMRRKKFQKINRAPIYIDPPLIQNPCITNTSPMFSPCLGFTVIWLTHYVFSKILYFQSCLWEMHNIPNDNKFHSSKYLIEVFKRLCF